MLARPPHGSLRPASLILAAGLVAFMGVLASPSYRTPGRAAPGGIRLSIREPRAAGDSRPMVAWSAVDSSRLYAGYFLSSYQPIAPGVELGRTYDLHSPGSSAEATQADLPQFRGIWPPRSQTDRGVHVVRVGLTLWCPRLSAELLVPFPNRVDWEPRGFGLEIIRNGSRTLLRRWVWNSRVRVRDACGIMDPRGEWTGFVSPIGSRWELWIWPRPMDGDRQ
jgi:hypothetical protein